MEGVIPAASTSLSALPQPPALLCSNNNAPSAPAALVYLTDVGGDAETRREPEVKPSASNVYPQKSRFLEKKKKKKGAFLGKRVFKDAAVTHS